MQNTKQRNELITGINHSQTSDEIDSALFETGRYIFENPSESKLFGLVFKTKLNILNKKISH